MSGLRRENNVGDVRQSILSEAQFQALNGTGWVLMDGRNITGSGLATVTGSNTLPDARGLVLSTAGTQTLGGITYSRTLLSAQGDQMQGHKHTAYDVGLYSSFVAGAIGVGINASGGAANIRTGVPISDGTNGTPRTGSETRMANIAVNTFIKIN